MNPIHIVTADVRYQYVAVLCGCALSMLATGAAAATLSGVNFGNSGSGLDWSSDLGLDYGKPATDEAGIGGGTTTPARPNFAGFAGGETLFNAISRPEFGGLSSQFQATVAATGDVVGNIHYAKISNSVPAPFLGIYGLFAASTINEALGFSDAPTGGIIGPSHVFYAYSYRISGAGAMDMSYDINFGDGFVGESGIAFGPRSGTRFGVKGLTRGDGGNSFSGGGATSVRINFGLANGAGSALPGGAASLEIWYTFSGEPIATAPIPLPAPVWLLGSALGGLGFLRRHIAAPDLKMSAHHNGIDATRGHLMIAARRPASILASCGT